MSEGWPVSISGLKAGKDEEMAEILMVDAGSITLKTYVSKQSNTRIIYQKGKKEGKDKYRT
jgi:hypothetical protein